LIQTAGSGGITITGNRGNGNIYDDGIDVDNSTVRSTATGTGAIQLIGAGSAAVSSNNNFGIYVKNGAVIESLNSIGGSSITLTATGGAGFSGNSGVRLTDASTQITSTSGAISIFGTGGAGSGSGNSGVEIFSSALVQTAGSAGISVTG